MANYKQLSYGSQGDDVKNLQKKLNSSGYNLAVDGIFGSNTQNAVRDYQKKNNLAVDGIVGEKTGGALGMTAGIQSQSSGSNNNGNEFDPSVAELQNSGEGNTGDSNEGNPGDSGDENPGDSGSSGGNGYEKSDAVREAEELLRQHLANKPGEYQSEWQAKLDEILKQILNREKFSYDLNGDALYQQYKDQYVLQGRQAMMDTMGQAQAMTGGYGNSYAQGVGQQTYQGYLQGLNDKVPELYELALSQYNREGEDMYNQYGMYMDRENEAYGRYRDQMSDYYTELDRLAQDARYQGEMDYEKYMEWLYYQYQKERDQKSDEQWQAEFDEAKRQYDQEYEQRYGSGSGNGGSGSDNDGSGGGGFDNQGYSSNIVKQAQAWLGVTADGMWGSKSAAAAKAKGYNSIADVLFAMNHPDAPTGPDAPVGPQVDPNSETIKAFKKKIHPESQHDAVMRHKWGSYKQYLAYQIEHSGLSEEEQAYLISLYGIQESDADYKNP